MKTIVKLGTIFSCILASSLAWASDAPPRPQDPEQESLARWKAHLEKLRGDSSVVRLYGFQEGAGDLVSNLANGPRGSFALVGYSPYGVYRGIPSWPAPAPGDCPRWTRGRWQGKNALECGLAERQTIRSGFYGTSKGPFTVEAWVRIHELGEGEWISAPILTTGQAYKEGWRVFAERQRWCREGAARFVMGTPAGPVSTAYGDVAKFTFGVWHYLAVIWDGKEIRMRIDENTVSKPAPNPYAPPKQPKEYEDDINGLTLGGNIRFDIDELVIYDRVLTAEELASHASNYRPVEDEAGQRVRVKKERTQAAELARIEFKFPQQTGGYIAEGTPVNSSVQIPNLPSLSGCRTAKFTLISKETGAKVYEKERPIQRSKGSDASGARFSITPKRCGLYTAILSVHGAGGVTVRKEVFPIGVTAAQPSGRAKSDFILGIHHAYSPQPEARAVGATWARVTLDWAEIEPEKGLYRWENADRKIETATESGLHLLCCVTGWPKWLPVAEAGDPSDLGLYQNFLRILANRFRKNDVVAWEVWNAPAGPPYFRFREGAEAYRAVAGAAAETLRRESPGAKIVGAGVPANAPYFETWPATVLSGEEKAPLDAFVYQNAPGKPSGAGLAKVGETVYGEPGRVFPAWNTACGYFQPAGEMAGIVPGDFGALYEGRTQEVDAVESVSTYPCRLFSERQSASRQVTQILLERAAGAKAVFLSSGPNEYYPNWNTSDGNPSEKGIALAMLNSVLRDTASVEEQKTEMPLKLLRLNRPDEKAVFVILPQGKAKVKAALDGKIKAKDWMGNPVHLGASETGGVEIPLDETPLYLFPAGNPETIPLQP